MYPFNFRPSKCFVDFRKIFIAMPFDDKYEPVFTELIVPAIEKINKNLNENDKLKIYRGKDPKHTRSGWLEILENLYTARIVLGVISGDSVNVFYELGIAHATQQIERQLLIAEERYKPKFDLKDLIHIKYDPTSLSAGVDELANSIEDTLKIYDINNDRQISLAESKLSDFEFEVLRIYGKSSHFYLPKQASSQHFEGLAYLCHAGLLRLSTKPVQEEEELVIEFSYYWTDLGNAVIHRLKIIDENEMNDRISKYHKYFIV